VVFLNGEFIGGADQLGSLESSGQLAQRLRAEA
jgi:glutaredoxin-related protein